MTGGTGSLRYMAPEVADHKKYNEKVPSRPTYLVSQHWMRCSTGSIMYLLHILLLD